MEDTLETIKIGLRSVLIPFKNGATFRQIQSEYESRMCEDLPLRKLGVNMEELIELVPDVAYIDYSKSGELRVFAVVTDSTAHIQNMVSKQKVSSRMRVQMKQIKAQC